MFRLYTNHNNYLFTRRKTTISFIKNFLFTIQQDPNEKKADQEQYEIHFPYSTRIRTKKNELKVSKINVDDYQDAASHMNDFFWDNLFVKAFKIKKNEANQRVLYNMWLNHLHENLSLKSYYQLKPDIINGIIINSPHAQIHEYTDLLDLADMAETKELQNYFLALADIVKKPKIYSEYSKILEINGIGVEKGDRRHGIGKKLLKETIDLGKRNGFDRFRCDCTNCKTAESLFRYEWENVFNIPFTQYGSKMTNNDIKIYEKAICPPEIEM